jgi:hypothetical protein
MPNRTMKSFSKQNSLFQADARGVIVTLTSETIGLISQELLNGVLNGNSGLCFRTGLVRRLGVNIHDARFPLGIFPATGLSRNSNEPARRQSPVNPLGTMTPAITEIGLRARWIMTCINAKHCASRLGCRSGQPKALYDYCTIRANFLKLVVFSETWNGGASRDRTASVD